jgi:hypothetical protein
VLHDEHGKPLAAMTVFALSIRYLKDQFLSDLAARGRVVDHSEILWVLTVPAIWDDAAKQFMRKAANEVNISKRKRHENMYIMNSPQTV